MPIETSQNVTAWSGSKSTPGEVRIIEWNSRERLIRAAKVLALCWGIALITIPIPMVHFVVPPIMLLVGPFLFYVNYKQENGVAGGQGTCPSCSQKFDVVSGKLRWPIFEICNHCKSHVRLEKNS